jgi:inner membrane protein involved in colicin E2 resistance
MNLKLALKLLVIGVVTGVILIALAMVNGTITDRQKYRDDAVKSIESSYAGPQMGQVEWGEPYLAMSVQDVRRIVGTPTVVVNGRTQGAGRGLDREGGPGAIQHRGKGRCAQEVGERQRHQDGWEGHRQRAIGGGEGGGGAHPQDGRTRHSGGAGSGQRPFEF